MIRLATLNQRLIDPWAQLTDDSYAWVYFEYGRSNNSHSDVYNRVRIVDSLLITMGMIDMRWPVFAIFALTFLVLEDGLRTLLTIGYTTPNLLLILMVFVGLWAPSMIAGWAAVILGVLTDLGSPIYDVDLVGDVALIGPACLGYLCGTYVICQLRGMVFRDSSLAVGVLVAVAGAFVHLVIMAMLTVRGLPWPVGEPIPGWSAADQLVARFFDLLYTAVLAVPIGYVLIRLKWAWGFTPSGSSAMGSGHHRR